MKAVLATTCLIMGAFVAPIAHAADSDADRNKPGTYVKDSAITTMIKTKLAAEHPGSLTHIKVDTDMNGVVFMSGTANSQQEIDQAVTIAKNTDGVKSVKADLKVQKDK